MKLNKWGKKSSKIRNLAYQLIQYLLPKSKKVIWVLFLKGITNLKTFMSKINGNQNKLTISPINNPQKRRKFRKKFRKNNKFLITNPQTKEKRKKSFQLIPSFPTNPLMNWLCVGKITKKLIIKFHIPSQSRR